MCFPNSDICLQLADLYHLTRVLKLGSVTCAIYSTGNTAQHMLCCTGYLCCADVCVCVPEGGIPHSSSKITFMPLQRYFPGRVR